uniref:Uncharacterized protein n=1 Tax=Neovison vison TaxID=452646 RepID=A0A8C7AMV5_NEOVI
MNKLWQSFRRKKDVSVPEASRPRQGQTDAEGVRTGKCPFPVKDRGPQKLMSQEEGTGDRNKCLWWKKRHEPVLIF